MATSPPPKELVLPQPYRRYRAQAFIALVVTCALFLVAAYLLRESPLAYRMIQGAALSGSAAYLVGVLSRAIAYRHLRRHELTHRARHAFSVAREHHPESEWSNDDTAARAERVASRVRADDEAFGRWQFALTCAIYVVPTLFAPVIVGIIWTLGVPVLFGLVAFLIGWRQILARVVRKARCEPMPELEDVFGIPTAYALSVFAEHE